MFSYPPAAAALHLDKLRHSSVTKCSSQRGVSAAAHKLSHALNEKCLLSLLNVSHIKVSQLYQIIHNLSRKYCKIQEELQLVFVWYSLSLLILWIYICGIQILNMYLILHAPFSKWKRNNKNFVFLRKKTNKSSISSRYTWMFHHCAPGSNNSAISYVVIHQQIFINLTGTIMEMRCSKDPHLESN